MNKYLLNFFLIIFLFLNSNNLFSNEGRIIFKLSNKAFTTIDLEKRKNYLLFVGDNSNLSDKEILNDFVSVKLFYEYYIDSKKNIHKII